MFQVVNYPALFQDTAPEIQKLYQNQIQITESLQRIIKQLGSVAPMELEPKNEEGTERAMLEVINEKQEYILKLCSDIEKKVRRPLPDSFEAIFMSKQKPMNFLPPDIIVHIISFLDSPQQVRDFGMSCKQYLELSAHDLVWKNLYSLKFSIFGKNIEWEKEHAKERSFEHLQVFKKAKTTTVPSKQKPEWIPPQILLKPHISKSWKQIFLDTLEGKISCYVQVYNREMIQGFFRSHFDGLATFRRKEDKFFVEYFPHTEEIHPPRTELIPYSIHHLRMRQVPMDVRYHNPYLVYEGNKGESFHLKEEVELQWKRNRDGAFAWWYGVVHALEGNRVHIIFTQFPQVSPWHLLKVEQFLSEQGSLECGGWVGGIRKVEGKEKIDMKVHLKNEPQYF